MDDKRSIYTNYLIERLGFVEDNFKQQYVIELMNSYGKFNRLGAITQQEFDNTYNNLLDKETYKAEYFKNKYLHDSNTNLYIPLKDSFSLIDYLHIEISIKKRKNLSFMPSLAPYISATDIASYTYCPVSYAISKSFILPKISAAITGTALHERTFLLKVLSSNRSEETQFLDTKWEGEYIDDINILLGEDTSEYFKLMETAELIFSGHRREANSNKIFRGKKGRFVGQPDYIFLSNKKEYFVVEEKFVMSNSKDNGIFYENHTNQVASYIYGINAFPVNFGLLIYWHYDNYRTAGRVRINKVTIKRIEKTARLKNRIKSVFSNIEFFKNNKLIDFDVSARNAKKCAHCVYTAYCGHKTGNYKKVSLPYSIGFINLKNVGFPSELKNDKE